MRDVCGVCDMCKCFDRGGVRGIGSEWVTGLGLRFTNSGGVRNILLLPLVARCIETIYVCVMYMAHVCFYVCCSDCVGVCGNGCCVAAAVKDSVFSLRVLKYVVCLCKGCDGCCVLCLYCDAWSCRCSCMGSMSVSSCRCCMLCVLCVSCGSSQCCMTCRLLMLVEDARRDYMEEAYSRAGLMTVL